MFMQRGFTLIELMVTLAISVILLGLAAPSFTSMIQSNTVTSTVNTFLADMRFARSEAIRRGGRVVLCRSTDPEASSPSCATSSSGWESGWIVFHDLDGDHKHDSSDPLLRVQAPIASLGSIMVASGTMNYFNFVATGRLSSLSGGATTLTFGSSPISNENQRVVCVDIAGRARVAGNGYSSCD